MTIYNAEEWYQAMERGEVRAGDLVTGDVVNDMMNALPPVRIGYECAQLGEPYSHARDWKTKKCRPTYLTWRLIERAGHAWSASSYWEFCGACFAGQVFNREAGYEPTQNEMVFMALERKQLHYRILGEVGTCA